MDELQTSPSAEVQYSEEEHKISDRFNDLFYSSSSRCAGLVLFLSLPTLSLSLSLSVSLSLSLSICLSVSLCLSLSIVSLSLCLSVCLSLF
jgi:hypothetical protein